jgi:hypothetical protein
MRTIEARPSCGFLTTARLHGPHRTPVTAIALFVFSGTLQASGQGITATPAKVSSVITSRQESCSVYQSLATTSGCVSSDLFPLFNSQSLGNDWGNSSLAHTRRSFTKRFMTTEIKSASPFPTLPSIFRQT